MAKTIRTFTHCDVCLTAGEEVDATSISEDLPGLPKDADLCKLHRVEIVEPLLKLLADHGRQPLQERILCGHRGCTRDFKNKAARAQHLRQSHPEASIK